MFCDSFKDAYKSTFFFTYWMTLYNTFYIFLILLLQDIPVFQCLSIIILIIICMLASATSKPFKEKSVALIFFSNFACILIVAIINLGLAIQTAVYGVTSANDQVGSVVFYIILMNSGANMIIMLGKMIDKAITIIKNQMNRNKKPTAAIPRQVQIVSPNHPQDAYEVHNPRLESQNNNQSNGSPLRNNDVSVESVSRRYETSRYNIQNSLRTKSSRRRNEDITINSEPRRARSNPRGIEKNHRRINLD